MKNNKTYSPLSEEDLYDDPLYCSFAEILHSFGGNVSVSASEIWIEAMECYRRLSESKRPDLLVSGLVDRLCANNPSGDDPFLILISVVFMICCRDETEPLLREAGKKIAATVVGHPLLATVLKYQRSAEDREERNGNTIPPDLFSYSSSDRLEDDHSFRYGNDVPQIPDDLLSCIADKSRLDEFCQIIRDKTLPFIQSEEGSAQMWKIVMDVSKELGYVSSRCRTKRFSQLIAALCPEAGSSTKIDYNMQKYNKIKDEKENDLVAIRSRFQV